MTRSNAEYHSINYFSWLLSSTVNMRFLSTFGTKFNLFNFASLLIFRVDFTILVFFYVSLIQIYDIFSIFFLHSRLLLNRKNFKAALVCIQLFFSA